MEATPPPPRRFVLVIVTTRAIGASAMLLERCARALRFLGFAVLASRQIGQKAHPVDQANAAAQSRPQDRNRGLGERRDRNDDPGVN